MNRPLALAVTLVSVAALARTAAACESWKQQAKIDARTIHAVAEKYVVDHPGVCPTMDRLREEKEISASSKITDPWGTPYRIVCHADEVTVVSLGCDRALDTADDIVVPDDAVRAVLPAGRCVIHPPPCRSATLDWPAAPTFAPTVLVGLGLGGPGLLALAFADDVVRMEAVVERVVR